MRWRRRRLPGCPRRPGACRKRSSSTRSRRSGSTSCTARSRNSRCFPESRRSRSCPRRCCSTRCTTTVRPRGSRTCPIRGPAARTGRGRCPSTRNRRIRAPRRTRRIRSTTGTRPRSATSTSPPGNRRRPCSRCRRSRTRIPVRGTSLPRRPGTPRSTSTRVTAKRTRERWRSSARAIGGVSSSNAFPDRSRGWPRPRSRARRESADDTAIGAHPRCVNPF
jgi:hypothetical protein